MPHKLLVFNPSNYPRGGWVTMPWQSIAEQTGFDPDNLLLYQDVGTPLYYQVDQIDPDEPARDTLSFFLSRPAAPGSEHYTVPTAEVFIEEKVSSALRPRKPKPEQQSSIEIRNSRLDLRFNLTPEKEGGEGGWYAGSVRSVRLDKTRRKKEDPRAEFLDYYNWMFDHEAGHDPEKRCIQLDSIKLAHPDSQSGPYQQIYLFNQPYRLVSQCDGPVRKSLTLASAPFYYNYFKSPEAPPLRCELYRVFSLYEDREYVIEELFLNIKPSKQIANSADIPIYFEALYFTYMKLGWPHQCSCAGVPDWFAIGDLEDWLVYGFACDVHVADISYPHPSYPEGEQKKHTFSWRLPPCGAATCLHFFSKFQLTPDEMPKDDSERVRERLNQSAVRWFEAQAGHNWYEFIYKPLIAKLADRGEAAARGDEHGH